MRRPGPAGTGECAGGRLAAVYVGKRGGGIEEAKDLFGMGEMPDYTKPPAMESGGGGLVSTTMDYARFSQMVANKGELDGVEPIPKSQPAQDVEINVGVPQTPRVPPPPPPPPPPPM